MEELEPSNLANKMGPLTKWKKHFVIEMEQPFRKTAWQFFTKLDTELPYEPPILLLVYIPGN